MQPGSRLRRRALSVGFLALSTVILLAPPEGCTPGVRWKGLVAAPAFLLLGAVGLVFGGCAFFGGLCLGAWLAFAG